MGIRLDTAILLALFLETLLFGVFLTLFIVMVFVLWTRNSTTPSQSRVIIPVGTFMLIIAVAHLIITFVNALNGFTRFFQDSPDGAIGYLSDIASPLFLAQTILFVIQTFVGDSLLLWRMYVVYGSRKWLLPPMIVLLLSTGAVGFAATYFISRADQAATIFATSTPFITSHVVLTMSNCIICTSAVAWKIYQSGRDVQGPGTISVWPVALAVADSGALYTAAIAAHLSVYLSKSNGQYCSLGIMTPMIGITFCLIILQIRYHLDSPRATLFGFTGRQVSRFSVAPPLELRGSVGVRQASRDLHMRPLQVNVTSETDLFEDDLESLQYTGKGKHSART